MIDFSQVNGVKIAAGEVIRITEKATGRVLWELEYPSAGWQTRTITRWSGGIPGIGDTNAVARIITDYSYMRPGFVIVCCYRPGNYNDGFYDFSIYSDGDEYKFTWGSGYGVSTREFGHILAMAGDGAVLTTPSREGESGGTVLYRFSNPFSVSNNDKRLRIDATEASSDSMRLLFNTSRMEYLVSGTNKGSFVLPYSFTPSTTITYDSNNIRRVIWGRGQYLGATGIDGNVYRSSDGKAWSSVQVFSSGNVLGVCDLEGTGQVCAVNSIIGKVALSRNGTSWTEYSSPFSSAQGYAYAPDKGILCVVDRSGGHVTKDFNEWVSIPYPAGKSPSFRDLIYVSAGVFIGHEKDSDTFYLLTTTTELK